MIVGWLCFFCFACVALVVAVRVGRWTIKNLKGE